MPVIESACAEVLRNHVDFTDDTHAVHVLSLRTVTSTNRVRMHRLSSLSYSFIIIQSGQLHFGILVRLYNILYHDMLVEGVRLANITSSKSKGHNWYKHILLSVSSNQ